MDGEPFDQARREMENENHLFLEELEKEKRILKQKEETQNMGEET